MKKILLILPICFFLIILETLFLEIRINPETDPISHYNSLEEKSEKELTEITRSPIAFSKGLIPRYFLLNNIKNNLADASIPPDAVLMKTVNRLERTLLYLQIGIFFNIFLIFLTCTFLVALFTKAYFGKSTGYFLLFSSFFYHFGNFVNSARAAQLNGLGYLGFGVHLSLIVLTILGIRYLKKHSKNDFTGYTSLMYSGNSEDDVRTPISDPGSGLRIIYHFVIIIVSGLLLGNLLYLPLFQLQKHFTSEFGMLLGLALASLCVFYIYNYYKIGMDRSRSRGVNLSVGFAYLQYRFLKNTFYGIIITAGVIFFITILFSILYLNTSLLKTNSLLDKGIGL